MSEHENQEPEQQDEQIEDLEPSQEQAEDVRGGDLPSESISLN